MNHHSELKLIFNKFKEMSFPKEEDLWSNLPSDVLRIIFNKLKNKCAFAKVCRSWCSIADNEIFLLLRSSGPKSVLLLFLDREELAKVYVLNFDYYMFRRTENNGKIREKRCLSFAPAARSQVISSCRGGWTLLSEKETKDLRLWSLLYEIKIRLPCFPSSSVIKAATFFGDFGMGVAALSENGKVAAFLKYRDSKWSHLCALAPDEGQYEDIISSEDSILALSKNGESVQIQAWNFNGTNILDVKLDFPQDMEETERPQEYEHKLYIAESKGRVYLVVRWLEIFVHYFGRGSECDIYETVNFYVYFLDDDTKGWNRLKSLDDQALFIGKNQTVLLRAEDFEECRKNSIYFTDYYWIKILKKNGPEEFNRDYNNLGAFCLEDSVVRKSGYEFSNLLSSFWTISGV